jgi:twitching motility protein PilT
LKVENHGHDPDRPSSGNDRPPQRVGPAPGRRQTADAALHGHLRELQTKTLEPEDTVALMKSITPERIQQEYEEQGSGDFGFAYGEEARFRVAIFKQKGYCSLVLRKIPNKIMTFAADRPAGDGRADLPPPARDLPGDRADRLGQDDDAGEHDQLHQRELRPAHHHDGRPDRVLPPAQEAIVVQREIGVDVPNFSEALRRASASGPGRDAGRRNARPGDDLVRDHRRRTGHLVFGTLHTSGAASTINRIIDAFPTDQQEQVRVQLADNLIAVLRRRCARASTDGHAGGVRVHVRHAGFRT